jgi:hypothetical protein
MKKSKWMKENIWWMIWICIIIAIFLLVLLTPSPAMGQSCPGDYGCAQFYRNDAWPRDGLIDHWTLDPGVQGDITNDLGDFETWTGAEGGCTDCPTGWTCDCTTFGGDINSESTTIYKSDTSARLDATGDIHSLLAYSTDYEANVCYQFDFCYAGEDGTEDLRLLAGNNTFLDTFNWATDTWAAGQSLFLTNIGTAWTCTTTYLTTGGAAKNNYLFILYPGSADGTYIYVDNVRFQRLNNCSITGSRDNVLSVPVTSDQQWGHSEVLLPRTGTGPAYKTGMVLDGTDDYLNCADATCEMDPVNWDSGGYFSVGCRVVADTVAAGTDYLISKYGGAGSRSWEIHRSTSSIFFNVSDDGTNTDSNSVDFLVADVLHSFVSTWDPSGGSGACENNIYYNAYQTDTDATMTECIPFNTAVDFQVGSLLGISPWDGSILECVLWEKELSAIEANKYISPYFPGTDYADGFYVDTCSQAASHATCSTQKCRDGTPNACQAEGTGAMAIFGQYTEITENNSFETDAGTDDAPNWNDWTETEVAGDGTSNITAYRADVKHGDIAARLSITGTTATASLRGECETVGIGADLYIYLDAISFLGLTATMTIVLTEFDTAACATELATQTIYSGTVTEYHEIYGGLIDTWNGSTSSYYITITLQTGAGDVIIDTVSVKAASYFTPWIENPSGSGTTTANSRQYELHNPLSDYCESEDDDCYASGFCASAWVYTDWAGDDGVYHTFIDVPGTAGNNNRWRIVKNSNDTTQFHFYSAAANNYNRYSATLTDTSFTAGGWKYIEVCTDNSTLTKAHHYNHDNATWYDWNSTAGGAFAVQDGQSSDMHIGHGANANYCDCYQPEIHISPYNAIYPNQGFNSGNPPVNGSPY